MTNNINTNAAEAKQLLQVSSSPHLRDRDSVTRIMLDVLIALIPTLVAGVVFFGIRSLLVVGAAIAACVGFEALTQKMLRKPVTIYDLSAVVTGLLLGLNFPSTMPIWIIILASFFAIVVVKQLFGGLGSNFMNPALAGRVFVMATWPAVLLKTVTPFQPDAVGAATPLASGKMPALIDMFIGKMPGMIGEVSALAILAGALYLVVRGVIHLRIPIVYLGTFAFSLLAIGGITGRPLLNELPAQMLAGGLLLGACFMATDYATTPMTARGQIIFAVGCGFLTAVIRIFGSMPEGVSYSILLMNICTPFIDKYVKAKPFGGVK